MLRRMKKRVLRGGLISLLVVGTLVSLLGISYSADIDEINRVIQSRGLNWVAKETPLSHLTAEEMKGWTGALEPSPPYTNQPANQTLDLPGGVPSSFDWTSNGGKNYVTNPKNQKGCGGCWAFATTGALEAKALINLNLSVDLAEQIVISCTDSMAPATDNRPNNCTAGGYMETAADFLKDVGTNLESFYPFTEANGSCGTAGSGWQTDPYKIDSWSLVYQWGSPDINTLKNAVQTHGPVVVWMKVYSDFQSFGSGVYHYTSGNYAGNHFVLVIGWDDAKSAFHVKNSWGTNWGESGLFWMAYSEFGNSSQTQFARGAMYFGNAVHTNPQPPTPQCDLAVGFDVTISGKVIEDGYYSSNFTTGIMYFDICTSASGETTDYFEGFLYDDSNDYWSVAGTIIWNHAFTSGYIQGANLDATASYVNGTIKYSRGKFTLSSIGGNSDGEFFIEIYSSIKGPGYELLADRGSAGAALKARKNKIQNSGKTKLNRVSK
jgi:C1A family cysteine protease